MAKNIERGVSHTQANEPSKSAGGLQLTDFRATTAGNPDPFVISDDKPAIKNVDFVPQWDPVSTFLPDQESKEHTQDNDNLEEKTEDAIKDLEHIEEVPSSVKVKEIKVEKVMLSVQQNVCTVCKLLQVLLY